MNKALLRKTFSNLFVSILFSSMYFPNIAKAQSQLPSLTVGANVAVSADPICHRMETTLAADPRNAANLLATSSSSSEPACKVVFHSNDGGKSWSKSPLPEGARDFGDPQLTFDENDAGYYASLLTVSGAGGPAIGIFRSADSGLTWREKGIVPFFHQRFWDHEMIAFDRTDGRFRGRMYVFANSWRTLPNSSKTDTTAAVLFSRDGGSTFSKPVFLMPSGNGKANTSNNIVVLRDGTVAVHYSTTEISHDKTFVDGTEYVATSVDGGSTFSKPKKILQYRQQQPDFSQGDPVAMNELTSLPSLATDASSTQFKDRLYLAWGDWRSNRNLIWFSHSSDHGARWTVPAKVAGIERESIQQFQPAVAVNQHGLVLISWYQTDLRSYDVYAAASANGGRSFGPPVRVTSVASTGSPLFGPGAATDIGDYLGIAADANGAFHLTWMDKRNGVSEIYTARVDVAAP